MDFTPQPKEAKKFGTVKWFKWHMCKYPHVFMMAAAAPILVYKFIEMNVRYNRELAAGTYVPNVVRNRYAIVRPSDFLAENTPKRYTN